MIYAVVRDYLKTLSRQGEANTVKFVWISGHFGTKGNRIADDLARQASRKPFVGPESACGQPYEKNTLRGQMGKDDLPV